MEIHIAEGSDMFRVNGNGLFVLGVSKREVAGKIYDRALHVVSQLEALGAKARGCLAVL